MNYSELLQLAKGWGNFKFYRDIIWRLHYYGVLMNNKCETLAELPYLSDVFDNEIYFDYSTGNVRKSRIYNIDEQIALAQEVLKGGD